MFNLIFGRYEMFCLFPTWVQSSDELFSDYPALTTSCQYLQINPRGLCPHSLCVHTLIFFSCSDFLTHSLQTTSVFLTLSNSNLFLIHIHTVISIFFSFYLLLQLLLSSLSLSLCICQSRRRTGQTHTIILRESHTEVTASRDCWQLGACYPELILGAN